MTLISTPVPAGTPLGQNDAPGSALRGYATLLDSTLAEILGTLVASPDANSISGRLKTIATGVSALAGYEDGVEGLLTLLNTYTDGLEGLAGTGNSLLTDLKTLLATQAGYLDGVETLIGSTNTTLGQIQGFVDGLETLTGTSNSLLSDVKALLTTQSGYVDGLEALQQSVIDQTKLIGTRAYGTPLGRLTVSGTVARSGAITATEVLLHANTRCFVRAGVPASVTPTTDDIPLESGEKFHLRITSGQGIGVIQDTAGGFLNVVPVA